MNRAVFLDRDGVINRPAVREGKSYPPESMEDFSIYPDVAEACARLKAAGFLIVVVTNQPDVGRGTQRREVVEAMHARMCAAVCIDRVEVCYDSEMSQLYKPATGMLLRAASDLLLDLSSSFMVGDRWRDVDCGRAAGCTTIFIERGYRESLRQQPDYRAASLGEATEIILRRCQREGESCL